MQKRVSGEEGGRTSIPRNGARKGAGKRHNEGTTTGGVTGGVGGAGWVSGAESPASSQASSLMGESPKNAIGRQEERLEVVHDAPAAEQRSLKRARGEGLGTCTRLGADGRLRAPPPCCCDTPDSRGLGRAGLCNG